MVMSVVRSSEYAFKVNVRSRLSDINNTSVAFNDLKEIVF